MKEQESVILVDPYGNALSDKTGKTLTMEKLSAHKKGVLHLAVSVFVFNDKGELLLQRRSLRKYHSPGKWTNTCCTHPRLDETLPETSHRRLREEMGIDCDLKEAFTFVYKADVGEGLIENEFDHVFIGKLNVTPSPNPKEVCEWKYISLEKLELDIASCPENYTVWFRICLPEIIRRRK